ncbi:MAG: hypothetical protein H6907_13085 [Hyphomicrobiales bacterium]|nr:hypothetical protein [Hyphomicrobiales bacterium]
MFLNGIDVGHSGLVVADQWDTCPFDKFLVKMPYAKEGTLRIVTPGRELFLDVNRFSVPPWMPPVSIEDNALLHQSLIDSLAVLAAAKDQKSVGDSLIGVIDSCWRNRLPLQGTDVWPMVEAHGIPPHRKSDFINLFDFGKNILISTLGRAAVKRRRMPAMSQGRYLTKKQRDLLVRLFGHV